MADVMLIEDIRMHYQVRTGIFKTIPLRAVDGVTLAVPPGQTLGLVGESGSGKTSLGKLTLRLMEPTAGHLYFKGKEITHVPEGRLKWFRREAQMIFQDPFASLDPFMTVDQIVEEPLIIHRIQGRESKVHRALEAVRLTPVEEFINKYPHMLSGGQRQRVAIARTLILNPSYIVADEPVSMIDASSRVSVLQILSRLQKEYNLAFIYITHDVATARYFSDRLAVMYLGKIVEMAAADELISTPLHPYTAALIAAVPDPDPTNRLTKRRVIPGEPPSPINPPPGCRFHPRCPYAAKICRDEEPPLREVEPGRYAACHFSEKLQDDLLTLAHGHVDASSGRSAQPPTGASPKP